jgi:broad specificity phosphatase PhoE
LSTIYLVRHGQAGTREAYDSLSELGKRQARLLGEHFVSQGIHFAAAYSGELWRQGQTAEQIRTAYSDADAHFPSLEIDRGWNEFNLEQVSSELAPHLCAQDRDFRREYEEMLQQVRASNGVHAARVHRKWLPCDTKIVEAWIRERFPYSGESWKQFCERVLSCRSRIDHSQARENILVVTSATPIAIWSGVSLGISDERVMRLAGALYNASCTILRLRHEELRLFTFNAASHLSATGVRTHR